MEMRWQYSKIIYNTVKDMLVNEAMTFDEDGNK
jgi:hypothetical protein